MTIQNQSMKILAIELLHQLQEGIKQERIHPSFNPYGGSLAIEQFMEAEREFEKKSYMWAIAQATCGISNLTQVNCAPSLQVSTPFRNLIDTLLAHASVIEAHLLTSHDTEAHDAKMLTIDYAREWHTKFLEQPRG